MNWKRALGDLRVYAPDIPVVRGRIKFLWDHIERLEAEIDALRRALIEQRENAGEGE